MNWDEFRSEIKDLAKKIDYTPDIIIGIVRGGLIPARLLSGAIKTLDTKTSSFFDHRDPEMVKRLSSRKLDI